MVDVLPMFFAIAVGLCLALMLVALWNSLRGLFAHAHEAQRGSAGESSARLALLREKEELLNAIRELRFEHELGKVSDADFQRLDQRYRTRARDVLRELDEQLVPYRPRARALLDQALSGGARPSAEQPAAPSPVPDAPVAERLCPQCSTRNDGDAQFCKKCGTRLRQEAQV